MAFILPRKINFKDQWLTLIRTKIKIKNSEVYIRVELMIKSSKILHFSLIKIYQRNIYFRYFKNKFISNSFVYFSENCKLFLRNTWNCFINHLKIKEYTV